MAGIKRDLVAFPFLTIKKRNDVRVINDHGYCRLIGFHSHPQGPLFFDKPQERSFIKSQNKM